MEIKIPHILIDILKIINIRVYRSSIQKFTDIPFNETENLLD